MAAKRKEKAAGTGERWLRQPIGISERKKLTGGHMVHQPGAQSARGLMQTLTLRSQQDGHRLNRGGRQHHLISPQDLALAIGLINHHDPVGAVRTGGDHEPLHQMLRQQRNASRRHGTGQGAAGAA